MLAKKFRVSSKRIEEVKKKGKLIQGDFFGVVFMKNNKENSRFSFVISKKISKKAVERNRIKRVLIKAIKTNLEKVPPGFDFVFLVKRKILNKEEKDIVSDLSSFLFEKITKITAKI